MARETCIMALRSPAYLYTEALLSQAEHGNIDVLRQAGIVEIPGITLCCRATSVSIARLPP
ncbi:hypothetical protein [Streptomyces sp. AFD10]|uniref:hypothetical protein n=1 Tax=Streptomyces sp. AFD10 TaxID=3050948 RepID=UPI0034DF02DD